MRLTSKHIHLSQKHMRLTQKHIRLTSKHNHLSLLISSKKSQIITIKTKKQHLKHPKTVAFSNKDL